MIGIEPWQERWPMRLKVTRPVDLKGVRLLVYHLPQAQMMVVSIEPGAGAFEPGYGVVLDTSKINGILHYFPRGNA